MLVLASFMTSMCGAVELPCSEIILLWHTVIRLEPNKESFISILTTFTVMGSTVSAGKKFQDWNRGMSFTLPFKGLVAGSKLPWNVYLACIYWFSMAQRNLTIQHLSKLTLEQGRDVRQPVRLLCSNTFLVLEQEGWLAIEDFGQRAGHISAE